MPGETILGMNTRIPKALMFQRQGAQDIMDLLRPQRCSHRPLYFLETEIALAMSKLQPFKVTVTSRWGGMAPQGRTLKPVHWHIQTQEVRDFSTELMLKDTRPISRSEEQERIKIR